MDKVRLKVFKAFKGRVFDLDSERDTNIIKQIKTLYGEENVEIIRNYKEKE